MAEEEVKAEGGPAPAHGGAPVVSVEKKKKKPRKPYEINFYSYPKLMFTWPLIAIAPLFGWLQAMSVRSEVLGWIYLTVMCVVLFTLSVDIERNHVFMIGLAVIAIVFGAAWLASAKDIPVMRSIFNWFGSLDLEYNAVFAYIIALFLLIGYVIMLVGVRINSKWRITHNEIEQRSWGRREKAYPRIGKTFRTTYPDWLEAFLCLSGSLLISDSRGDRVVEQVDHIPLLPFLSRKLDTILETWAVTIQDQEATIMVAEEESVADEESRM